MSLMTTVVGAYPKPDFLQLPDWFRAKEGMTSEQPTRSYEAALKAMGEQAEALLTRAAKAVITDQIEAGIDIPTDGEIRRENYIHYHCRHLTGFDFENLTQQQIREGAASMSLPTIAGPIKPHQHFLPHDWKIAQGLSSRPLKITLPGPLTIMDTTADAYYQDRRKLGKDLAEALNFEIRALADAGAVHIQVDEPIMARRVQDTLDFGLELLERCFHKVPSHVVRTVHTCCGYPDFLDQEDYLKAPQESYLQLADALDYLAIDAISIEDAHRHNDLGLLEKFQNIRVIFGVVAVARSRVESLEEIRVRLQAALEHIDPERLWAAPDCGLGLLPRELARAKLTNLCAAVKTLD